MKKQMLEKITNSYKLRLEPTEVQALKLQYLSEVFKNGIFCAMDFLERANYYEDIYSPSWMADSINIVPVMHDASLFIEGCRNFKLLYPMPYEQFSVAIWEAGVRYSYEHLPICESNENNRQRVCRGFNDKRFVFPKEYICFNNDIDVIELLFVVGLECIDFEVIDEQPKVSTKRNIEKAICYCENGEWHIEITECYYNDPTISSAEE
jgi:hypothetical protein